MRLRGFVLGSTVVIALAAGLLVQRRSLVRAEVDNRALADAIAGQDQSEPETTTVEDAMANELPRLRNEVRQLRAQQKELETLRADNARLEERLQQARASQASREPSPEQGFIMAETWSSGGYATPESTLQSFLSALRGGNGLAVLACLTPEALVHSKQAINPETGEILVKELRALGQIKGFRIAETKAEAEDRVKLKVQAAVNGETIELPLQRIGQEWKLDM